MAASSSGPRAIPWSSRPLRAVLLTTLVAPLGVPLISPALPAIRDALQLTDARASLLVSAYFATGVVLAPIIGALAEQFGRRRVLVGSLVGFATTGSSIALAPPFPVVLGLRVVQGSAAAGLFVTTVIIIGDRFTGVQRNAVLGVNAAALTAGAAVYPLVGGLLVRISWSAPFAVYAVALPVGIYVARVLEPRPARRERDSASTASARGRPGERLASTLVRTLAPLRDRRTLPLYVATLVGEALFIGAIITTIPFLLDAVFAPDPVVVGGVVTAVAATAAVVAAMNGRLAATVDERALVAAGVTGLGAGLLAIWRAGSLPVVAVGAVIFGAGVGLYLPSVDGALSEAVADERRAAAIALRTSTTFLGRTTGPLAFAAATGGTVTGYRHVFLVAGAPVAALGVVSLIVVSR